MYSNCSGLCEHNDIIITGVFKPIMEGVKVLKENYFLIKVKGITVIFQYNDFLFDLTFLN